MKIDKAIEILDLCVKGCNPYLSKDTDKARKLGIEALTYIIRLRACSLQHRQAHLPSEDS